MTIVLELSPDQETRVRDFAARVGVDPVAYIQSLIDSAPTPPEINIQTDWLADLVDELAVYNIPDIDASREGIYADL